MGDERERREGGGKWGERETQRGSKGQERREREIDH